MDCPRCNSTNIKNFGKTKAGTQRYRCNECLKTWSDNPKRGQPTIGLVAMTNAEKQKAYRARKRKQIDD